MTTDFSGNEGEEATVANPTAGIPGAGQAPRPYALHQSQPNPGTGGSTISFDLPVETAVTVTIFDVAGRRVVDLVDHRLGPGTHTAPWRGIDDAGNALPSGIYFYRLETEEFSETKKLLLTW